MNPSLLWLRYIAFIRRQHEENYLQSHFVAAQIDVHTKSRVRSRDIYQKPDILRQIDGDTSEEEFKAREKHFYETCRKMGVTPITEYEGDL